MSINLIIPKEMEGWVREAPDGAVLPLGDFYIFKVHGKIYLKEFGF